MNIHSMISRHSVDGKVLDRSSRWRVRLLAMLAATLVLMLSGCDWPMFGGDAMHSRYNPGETTIGVSNVSQLAVKWSENRGSSIDSSSAVANGMVYVGLRDGRIFAYTAGGGYKWTASTTGSVSSSPAVADGIVYVGSNDGTLYAFDATNGLIKWSRPVGTALNSSPTVINGFVYVAGVDGTVLAFNASTGGGVWRANAPVGGAASSPAVANGILYVGSRDGNLYAYDAAGNTNCSGAGGLLGAVKACNALWMASTGGAVHSSPSVANGTVYVGSDDGKLYAFDAASGSTKWSAQIQSSDIESSPAVANGVVYVGTFSGTYALDALSGITRWVAPGASPYSSPAVANGVVYIGGLSYGGAFFQAIDAATGGVKAMFGIGGTQDSSPTVANGMVYIGADDGSLQAFGLP